MRACIERALAVGAHRLVLCTQPSMSAAHRLYGRLGFARDAARDWSPHPCIDLLGYTLDLSGPPGR